MLFVSRHANYFHTIRPEVMDILNLESGKQQLTVKVPPMNAQFRIGGLSRAERDEALAKYKEINPDMQNGTFGAIPSIVSGMVAGIAHEAYEPEFAISKFDTDTDINFSQFAAYSDEEKKRIKDIYETTLLASPEKNFGFFVIETRTLAPPWPTYDETPATKVPVMVTVGGFDPDYVLAYEQEHKQRKTVLDAVTKIKLEGISEREREQDTEAALTVEIPS